MTNDLNFTFGFTKNSDSNNPDKLDFNGGCSVMFMDQFMYFGGYANKRQVCYISSANA